MSTFTTYNWDDVRCIEDPVHSAYIDLDNYFKMFGPLLRTFDGSDADSHITEFFVKSPVNSSILTFVDEDSRLDFQQLAIEMKLIPQIKEIFHGETNEEKQKRLEREFMEKRSSRKQPRKRMILSESEISDIKMMQMAKTMDKLVQRLKNEENPNIRKRINDKIQRMNSHMRNTSV